MSRTEAVKMILNKIITGGLPRAIDIYNYLSCNNEIVVTEAMINNYIRG